MLWLTKSSLLFKRRKPPFPFVNISVLFCWIFSFQIKSLLWTGTCLCVFVLSNAMLKLGEFMFQITDLTFVVHLHGRLIAFDLKVFNDFPPFWICYWSSVILLFILVLLLLFLFFIFLWIGMLTFPKSIFSLFKFKNLFKRFTVRRCWELILLPI